MPTQTDLDINPMPPRPPASSGRIYYGWWVVGSMFIMLMVSSGLGFYNLSVILNALTRDGTYSVRVVSIATAVFFLTGAVAGVIIARLIEKYDPRYTIVLGVMIAAAGLLMVGRSSEIWQLMASYALFAVGFSCSSLIPGTTIVTRWFVAKRSLALSIASTGMSLGGIFVTPTIAALVASIGLREATLWMALAYMIGVIPVTILLLRPSPQSMGLNPDGASDVIAGVHGSDGMVFRDAVRTRYFVLITAAFTLVFTAQVGTLSHQFNLIAGRIDGATAALAVATMSSASMLGWLAGGWIMMKLPIRMVTTFLVALQFMALSMLAFSGSKIGLIGASAIFGIGAGNLLMLLPLLLADAFGVREYARIYSVSQMITMLGVASGPVLVGIFHDLSGGYLVPVLGLAATCLIGGVLFNAAGPFPDQPVANQSVER